jgi:SAM-dependent methyltransferase
VPQREQPPWSFDVLDGTASRAEDGILEGGLPKEDPGIQWYEAKGGARFEERGKVAFAMSSLETPLYHDWLRAHRPEDREAVIVDVGAGDGRNSLPFLEWGFRRLVAVEPIRPALLRLRERVRGAHDDADDRLVLARCDARQLPLRSASADLVLAIESLYYLNEDHDVGLAECARILRPGGRLLLASRTWEGALFSSLLYGSVGEMLRVAAGRSLWDGPPGSQVRSRVFTEEELRKAVADVGLKVVECKGLSLLALLLGYLRGLGRVSEGDSECLPAITDLLRHLEQSGAAHRALLVVACRQGPAGG